MNIPVTLNGEQTVIQAECDESLLSVLRRLNLFSVKSGCEQGHCGYCTVLVNDKPVPSCKLPVGILKNATIVTLEFFSKTPDYAELIEGFEKAEVKMCGFCNSAKVFSAYSLINTYYRPTKEQLIETADSARCSCTERDSFINGILYAVAKKHQREGRKNV